MSVWVVIAAVVLYLPWISMYRFMELAGYQRKWRAFVPVWNLLLMYDLADAGRGNAFWLLGSLPAVLVTAVIAAVVASADTGVSEGDRVSLSPEVTAGLVVIAVIPAFILVPAVAGRLAVRTGRQKTLGLLALPLVWLVGLPYLAFTAKINAGLPPEKKPLPPLTRLNLSR